jgi:acetoin utilization deacetylase AcuC-like enzyme
MILGLDVGGTHTDVVLLDKNGLEKPDIIINSAGQDNHYTDPLTNMNFSAQGYADQTAMLKPDIAVLEGGYPIEGALPYVNLGIVLAIGRRHLFIN